MILTYDNVLPEDFTTNFYCSKPTAKMRLIGKNVTLESATKVYKLIQEMICEVTRCVRNAQLVRLDQKDDPLLLKPFNISFGRHKITHTMLAAGEIYDYQLEITENATNRDLDKIEFLLRRVIVDYNCLWRYHQCIIQDPAQQRYRNYASLLEYAVGVISRFLKLTLAEHQEVITCCLSENYTSLDSKHCMEDSYDEDTDDSTHDSDVSESYSSDYII
jgi:hypothetical protein